MPPRPDVSEERRNQIIQAATTVFARSGFNKARMDDIALEAGVSKGTLYWYFESKDDIINTLLDDMVTRGVAWMAASENEESSAKVRLHEFAEEVVTDIIRMKPMMPIILDFWALLLRRKTGREVFSRYIKRYFQAIIPVIQDGIERGEFRLVDPEQVAIAAGSIFEGTIIMWLYSPEIVKLEEHILSSVDLLIAGIENPSYKPQRTKKGE
jgi:AcrR family transcriptional regulator